MPLASAAKTNGDTMPKYRIRTICKARGGVYARCDCGVGLVGSFYPLDLESVNDWMREHWIIAHANEKMLKRLAIKSVRNNDLLAAINWDRELR